MDNVTLRNYWNLPLKEQEPLRKEADCMTEEEYQAFLNALFPTFNSVEEADAALDLFDRDANHDWCW